MTQLQERLAAFCREPASVSVSIFSVRRNEHFPYSTPGASRLYDIPGTPLTVRFVRGQRRGELPRYEVDRSGLIDPELTLAIHGIIVFPWSPEAAHEMGRRLVAAWAVEEARRVSRWSYLVETPGG